MAQDFWASSGHALLERNSQGLRATPAWLARFITGPELTPPGEAGPGERRLHAQLAAEGRGSDVSRQPSASISSSSDSHSCMCPRRDSARRFE